MYPVDGFRLGVDVSLGISMYIHTCRGEDYDCFLLYVPSPRFEVPVPHLRLRTSLSSHHPFGIKQSWNDVFLSSEQSSFIPNDSELLTYISSS